MRMPDAQAEHLSWRDKTGTERSKRNPSSKVPTQLGPGDQEIGGFWLCAVSALANGSAASVEVQSEFKRGFNSSEPTSSATL